MGDKAYGIRRKIDVPFDQALTRVEDALKDEGFGILTEIDVRATLKKKLDKEFGRNYKILGTCNPHLAHQAFEGELEIGLLLPCNVIVYEEDGGTVVSALNPLVALEVAGNPALRPLGEEAHAKLQRVIERL